MVDYVSTKSTITYHPTQTLSKLASKVCSLIIRPKTASILSNGVHDDMAPVLRDGQPWNWMDAMSSYWMDD